MSVHHLPLSEERKAEIAEALNAPLLSLDDLLRGPVEMIHTPGPFVAQGNLIERIVATALALQGPGRVKTGIAAEALHVFADALAKVEDAA